MQRQTQRGTTTVDQRECNTQGPKFQVGEGRFPPLTVEPQAQMRRAGNSQQMKTMRSAVAHQRGTALPNLRSGSLEWCTSKWIRIRVNGQMEMESDRSSAPTQPSVNKTSRGASAPEQGGAAFVFGESALLLRNPTRCWKVSAAVAFLATDSACWCHCGTDARKQLAAC